MEEFSEKSNENVVEWITKSEQISLTLSQTKYVHMVERLSAKYPEEVQIIARNRDGTIFAHMPLSYLRFARPRQYTEEQKRNMLRRFSKSTEREVFSDVR